jgi:hypothetical protein
MCVILESVTPDHGAHVGLTGGTLYKKGQRKDCDVLFYRIRQRKCIDMDAMWKELELHDFIKVSGFGWCYKAAYKGKPVDCFFPEGARDENGNEIEYGTAQVDPASGLIDGFKESPF